MVIDEIEEGGVEGTLNEGDDELYDCTPVAKRKYEEDVYQKDELHSNKRCRNLALEIPAKVQQLLDMLAEKRWRDRTERAQAAQ